MDKKKQRFALIILSLMAFLANGDNYASAALISNIAGDLGFSISTASLSVTAYMLGFGLFTLIFGPLGDKYGKVKIINIAALGTALFSMLGSTAFNLPSLVAFRAMNGIFGSGIFPVTIAFVGEMFDDEDRHKAIAFIMSMGFFGSAMATIIGGTISYFASWRMVYLVYGVGEFVLALIMLKTLERDKGVRDKLELVKSYTTAIKNRRFITLVVLLLFVGAAVLGSFTYTGIAVMQKTGSNIFITGIVLASFGVATVFGGKLAPKVKAKLKNMYLIVSCGIGFIGLTLLSYSSTLPVIILALFLFGMSFIFMQSTLVTTAQAMLPQMKGTAMSMTSFNLFVGAAIGTAINANLMKVIGVNRIFNIASVILLLVGILSSILIKNYEIARLTAATKNQYA
jgi:predicted MFS family arabinose efflux permease